MHARLPLAAALAALAAPLAAFADDTTAAPAPWMAQYSETKDAPIGLDEADVKKYLDKELKSDWKKGHEKAKTWEPVWTKVFLLMTPAWKADVPAFALSKYEVTNAQWEKFLEFRTASYTTKKDDTLASITAAAYRLDPDSQGPDVQRGWQTILRLNGELLMKLLNPDGDPKWNALAARAAEKKLPAGIELKFPAYVPPVHWPEGQLPAAERRKPIRHVSWEQAEDFCRWAGFHLPTEFEWERAARGVEGRAFPWGAAWDPLRCVWEGWRDAMRHGGKGEQPEGVVEVDTLAEGANPEGVLHLAGNVSEFTSSRSLYYPETKCKWGFQRDTVVARGGNYADRAEFMLSADRNAESPNGPLLPSHAIEGYGFRLAAYGTSGADLTLLLAERYNDGASGDGPFHALPPAPGFEKRDAASDPFVGFNATRTAGIVDRKLVSDSPDHVFVTGPATSIAFMPVRGFSMEKAGTVDKLQQFASNPDRVVVLGVLTGSAQSGIELLDAEGKKITFAFADERMSEPVEERRVTREPRGLVLVWEAPRVAVYTTNASIGQAARHRSGKLGYLPSDAVIRTEKGVGISTGKIEDGHAVLDAVVPMLDKKAMPVTGGSATSFRVTVRVPFIPEVKAK